MARLGPFGRGRRVAVAVSGGADSTALALLAHGWGQASALVVDHRLRQDSTAEATLTLRRLLERGIEGRILTLGGLRPGPGLPARARAARYAALTAACQAAGAVDLLLGHHAGDQAETVAMRRDAGSGSAGLAGMAALRVTGPVRLLRPLLSVRPDRLRATVAAAGMEWVEDPANADGRFTRARVRLALAGRCGPAGGEGAARRTEEAGAWPAAIGVAPGGYATLPAGPLVIGQLAAAVWTVSGRPYPPAPGSVRRAAAAGAGTLGGTRIFASRGPRFVVREEAAMAPPVPALPGTVWDGRFQVERCDQPGLQIGPLGGDSALLRRGSRLPSAVLRTLPALRRDGALWAVPHLAYPSAAMCAAVRVVFRPARPVAGSPFVPSPDGSGVHLADNHPMFDIDGGSRPEPDGGFAWAGMPED